MEKVPKWKRTWNLAPVFQIVQNILENYGTLSIGQVWWLNKLWFKTYSKMHPFSCTNTHYDVTDLVNHWMIKNTKTWIPWKRNVTFCKKKNSWPVSQMTYFEELSFCTGGNLSGIFLLGLFFFFLLSFIYKLIFTSEYAKT